MFKFLTIAMLVGLNYQQNYAAIIPNDNVLHYSEILVDSQAAPSVSSTWKQHMMDFVNLIDVDKVVAVVMGYLSDPEVLDFAKFFLSDDFKKLVWDFESMAEFKEAFNFLADKGYEIDSIIDVINSGLQLPPFEKPKVKIATNHKGINGLIEDLLTALPIDEFKKLLESKLENDPEVAELLEVINTPEFIGIMKRMINNPEFDRIKEIFEGYGIDFKYLCQVAKEIFKEYYQGVFSE